MRSRSEVRLNIAMNASAFVADLECDSRNRSIGCQKLERHARASIVAATPECHAGFFLENPLERPGPDRDSAGRRAQSKPGSSGCARIHATARFARHPTATEAEGGWPGSTLS